MNRGVAAIWWFTLLATIFAVVPNAISWLERLLSAARNTEKYSEEILNSGIGIAENTSKIAALQDTLAVAPRLVDGAQSIESHVGALESALAGGGRRPNSDTQEG